MGKQCVPGAPPFFARAGMRLAVVQLALIVYTFFSAHCPISDITCAHRPVTCMKMNTAYNHWTGIETELMD